jgi:hypothetical protein
MDLLLAWHQDWVFRRRRMGLELVSQRAVHGGDFDQVEVIQDLYDLDLADDWRSLLEQHMLEDTDSEMLYQNAMDGFEGDIELNMQLGIATMRIQYWFEPFNDASVPPTCAEAQHLS